MTPALQAIIVAAVSGLLGGGAMAALITAFAMRRKVKVEADSILSRAATELVAPLERQLEKERNDNKIRDEIIRKQSSSYDRLEEKYDQTLYELRCVRADRDNLLAERIIYQKKTDVQADQISRQAETIKGLECRVAQLESELAALRRKECEDATSAA